MNLLIILFLDFSPKDATSTNWKLQRCPSNTRRGKCNVYDVCNVCDVCDVNEFVTFVTFVTSTTIVTLKTYGENEIIVILS
jgi:hypothetical protein